jgi:hypothetical protein
MNALDAGLLREIFATGGEQSRRDRMTLRKPPKFDQLLLGAALAAGLIASSHAQGSIKILMPAEDTCAALVHAMNAGDTTAMLSLGGWALGFLSGIAQQAGKDILHNTTSQGLLDQLTAACQKEPDKPMSSIVAEMATTLLAALPN